ncbi:unnamed protein product, partial [Iphiclides podalirius]
MQLSNHCREADHLDERWSDAIKKAARTVQSTQIMSTPNRDVWRINAMETENVMLGAIINAQGQKKKKH